MSSEANDPRRAMGNDRDIRPVVAGQRRQMPAWFLAALAGLAAILLFVVLDGQRRAATAPATEAVADRHWVPSQPPPLVVPVDVEPPPPPPPPPSTFVTSPAPAAVQAPTFTPPPAAAAAPPAYLPSPAADPAPSEAPAPASLSAGAALVIDTTSIAAGGAAGATLDGEGAALAQYGAARSTILRRRSNTVPQGTLIPAVLETALDSTRPGFVRAIVSRDVTGFDGALVLIPRGTRLFGEYQADLNAGQNRAFVQWTRLVRPDGVTMSLASPAADAEGRAGVQGRVDTHFLARFGSAFLQTILNIGGSLAGQSLGGEGTVVVALPGSSQSTTPPAASSRFQPTLRVDAGAAVTVFVARDLEFSSGEPHS